MKGAQSVGIVVTDFQNGVDEKSWTISTNWARASPLPHPMSGNRMFGVRKAEGKAKAEGKHVMVGEKSEFVQMVC